MAGMIPTLKLTVNLQCKLCRRKIRKVLGKLEDREKIQPPKYNEEEGTVIVSGPFDPKKLSKKLCCKACKIILDIEIVKEKPDSPVIPDPPPAPVKPDPPPSPVKPKPQKPEYIYLYPYPYPYPYPQPYSYPCPTVWPFIPLCGCNIGSCRCKSIVDPPPPPANPAPAPTFSMPCYYGCRSCKFICEEEPSTCSIM